MIWLKKSCTTWVTSDSLSMFQITLVDFVYFHTSFLLMEPGNWRWFPAENPTDSSVFSTLFGAVFSGPGTSKEEVSEPLSLSHVHGRLLSFHFSLSKGPVEQQNQWDRTKDHPEKWKKHHVDFGSFETTGCYVITIVVVGMFILKGGETWFHNWFQP